MKNEPYIQFQGRVKRIFQSESLPEFKKHTKEWFKNRVGEIVERSYSNQTQAKEKEISLINNRMAIADERHAEACYEYHKSKKVNFTETQIKTK